MSATVAGQQSLGVNENSELDWRYLSTEAYSSDYSLEETEDDDNDRVLVDHVSEDLLLHNSLGTRPFLATARSTNSLTSAAGPPSSSSYTSTGTTEVDDSTQTVKSMRARALDKINGRHSQTDLKSNRSGNSGNMGTNTNTSTCIDFTNSNKRNTGPDPPYSPTRSFAAQDDKATPTQASSKLKRRSNGKLTDRSPLTRINTKGPSSEIHPTGSLSSHLRKRNSGSFKSQQVILTSEEEEQEPSQSIFRDRARYAAESGGMLASEIKSLKARVQELEMERMNRSMSTSSLQSPQVLTPQSLEPPSSEDNPLTHSEKLQHILQKHRVSTVSVDSNHPLRSPVAPTINAGKQRSSTLTSGAFSTTSGLRLEPPVNIGSPSSITPPSPASTQHVNLLQQAFKAFEKTMGPATKGSNSPAQSMNKVVTHAISMNHTIRTWIKAEVSLANSTSISSLLRASDEQIRSLTESLLALTSQQSTVADRTLTPSHGRLPYSPISTPTKQFGQGPRVSLGMVGSELNARSSFDLGPSFPPRPPSSAAGSIAPSVMSASSFLSRANSVASSITRDNPSRGTRYGYTSNFGHDHHAHMNGSYYPPMGSMSSRESSPPQENGHAFSLGQRRHVQLAPLQQPLPQGTLSPRALQSPPLMLSPTSGNNSSAADTSAGLSRRQASVRNIMARYSQQGPNTPQGPRADQSQVLENYIHGHNLSTHYEDLPSVALPRHNQPHQQQQRQSYTTQRKDHQGQALSTWSQPQDPMTESVEFSSAGHARRSGSRHRPSSQQENRSMTGSLMMGSAYSGQQDSSYRYIREQVFSDDESTWGSANADHLHRSRANTTPFVQRLQPFRPQQGRTLDPVPQDRGEHSMDADRTTERDYSDTSESVMYGETDSGRFLHRNAYQAQRQKELQRHPSLATVERRSSPPAMPSPHSSPSSSAKLDGSSLRASRGEQGVYGESRYPLSPRMASSARQGLQALPNGPVQPAVKRAIAVSKRATLEQLSPQAQARFQHMLVE